MPQENMNEQLSLQDFISRCRETGVNDLIIRDNLLQVGWRKDIIDKALAGNIPVPIPQEKEKGSRSMWDAFEHILLFISLYTLVISIGNIFYRLIDIYVPELLNSYSYYSGTDSFSSPLAAAIVSFPLFLFFFVRIAKRTAQLPAIRNLPVRKQLIYGTLILAFIIALIDIIALIYNVLSGDLTSNSFLKMLVVLTLAGAVAGYYLIQIREDAAIRD